MATQIFNEEDLDKINLTLGLTKDLDEDIVLARQAGIDTGEFERLAKEKKAQLQKLKQTYFPGR